MRTSSGLPAALRWQGRERTWPAVRAVGALTTQDLHAGKAPGPISLGLSQALVRPPVERPHVK
jgi:hypothetical protein